MNANSRYILIVLLAILCTDLQRIHAQQPYMMQESYPKREIRAVWLTTLKNLDWPTTKAVDATSRERQKQELITILDRMQACGINQVLLQTRVRGSSIYPSAIEPWDQCLTGKFEQSPGYDPLKFAIEECHKRGMELHAWVVTIPCFDIEVAKKMGKKALICTHPEWLRKHNGKYYLDPGIPAVGDYLARICKEIVTYYDVDGIHFDYIRYPENNNTFPDAETYKKYGQGVNKGEWRRRNISAIVRKMYNTVKAIKPWVKVSSSPVGKFHDLNRYSSGGWNAYSAVYQDAAGWLREGIHDAIYPMMYFKGNHFYPFAADWQENCAGRMVAPGLGTYFLDPAQGKNWTLSDITAEINHVRNLGLAGTCHFREKFLDRNFKGIYDWARNFGAPYPALIPATTWIDSTPPSQPTNLSAQNIGNGMSNLTWDASNDNLGSYCRYNVYASREWPVDVTKAENLVATALMDTHYTYNTRTKLLNGLHFAVTAMDRCGNESKPASIDKPSGETESANEARGYQQIQIPADALAFKIKDVAGRTIKQGKLKTYKAKASQLSPGVYQVTTCDTKGREKLAGTFTK